MNCLKSKSLAVLLVALVAPLAAGAAPVPSVQHKHVKVGTLDVAYREAGPSDAPTLLLLHGFPTSSQMFRKLMPALADRYHVVAPDYPGFGDSSMPARGEFSYTFDNLADVVARFTDALGLRRYALYVQDYGAPVGYRLALLHPERVTALVVQNGNAYDEGLDNDFWKPFKKYWSDPSPVNRDALRGLLTLDATRWQYTHGTRAPAALDAATWTRDQQLLDRPGNVEIQLDLFLDYGSNPARYPAWQAWLRRQQPPTLIVWGRNDTIFPPAGAEPYKRDLRTLETHLLDTGHFALEEDVDVIARLMREFLGRHLPKR